MTIDLDIPATAAVVDCEELVPRIIQYRGQRVCIRLEDVYWNVLEDEAQTRGCKFNQLVHSYYTDPRAAKNKTAYLRRRTMLWMAAKVDHANERLSLKNTELRAVLRATIQPAIVFSEKQSVSRYNLAFRNWLADNISPTVQEPDFSKLRLSFRRSYKGIMDLLDNGGGSVINEQATFLIPGFVLSVRMNLVQVNKNADNEQLFLGILNPG